MLDQAVAHSAPGGVTFVDGDPQSVMFLLRYARTGVLPDATVAAATLRQIESDATLYEVPEVARHCRAILETGSQASGPPSRAAPADASLDAIPVARQAEPVLPSPVQAATLPHSMRYSLMEIAAGRPAPDASTNLAAVGVVVSGRLEFGRISPGSVPAMTLDVKNVSRGWMVLAQVSVEPRAGEQDAFTAQHYFGGAQCPVQLPPASTYCPSYQVTVHCQARGLGQHCGAVVLSFVSPSAGPFQVRAPASAEVSPGFLDVDAEPFRSVALQQLFDTQAVPHTVPEPPLPPSWTSVNNSVPAAVARLRSAGDNVIHERPESVKDLLAPIHDPAGTRTEKWWETLLWLEEAAASRDMVLFDMHWVPVTGAASCPVPLQSLTFKVCLVHLTVPGLPERRPHICYGDGIRLREVNSTDHEWLGWVFGVRPTADSPHVVVGLSSDFAEAFLKPHTSQPAFYVRFCGRRSRLRRCHAAVAAADRGEGPVIPPLSATRISWESAAIPRDIAQRPAVEADEAESLNEEQSRGVADILAKQPSTPPYLVYGPPGTGKTRVVVAAARRLAAVPGTRVLIAAPTDAAADVVCERLAQHCSSPDGREKHPNEGPDGPAAGRPMMLRLYPLQRRVHDVPTPAVIPFTWPERSELWRATPVYGMPPKEVLERLSIVVATCSAAGCLREAGATELFSHVLVDEAGQATEPETLIPLTLGVPGAVSVIAGDYLQLGPSLRSLSASDRTLPNPLNQSMLERLHHAHTSGTASGGCCVLLQQYRAHSALLATSNKLFYHGRLRASAREADTHSFVGWRGLPNPDIPFAFFGVDGLDSRDGDGTPSFYNLEESEIVARVAKAAVDDGRAAQEEINVIAPFRTQVYQIRRHLRASQLGGVRVGTVEDYQGQEGRVVILSTVRSRAKFLPFDVKHQLGVVYNRRRFNVSITRARALLVVVGSPLLLCKDPNWRALLRYAVDHKCYTGNPSLENLAELAAASPPFGVHSTPVPGAEDATRGVTTPESLMCGYDGADAAGEAVIESLLADLRSASKAAEEGDCELEGLIEALRKTGSVDDSTWTDDN
eukprot:TRINITY_DN21556_c0_g1_i3.p1 TRINITY_DN21556_c0_g1~~TRINITY_DN21556_c0_g1_i3.p1  ORF type:complete len:1065 (+),score=256.13 TRINITY_DN21556_c0_g1_i3:132-3326(+)